MAAGARSAFSVRDYALDDRIGVVEVTGELDVLVAPQLRGALVQLIEAGRVNVVVDLSASTFIDSTAIGVLYARVPELETGGGSLSLVCPDANLLRTFEVAGMSRAFPISATLDDFAPAQQTAHADLTFDAGLDGRLTATPQAA